MTVGIHSRRAPSAVEATLMTTTMMSTSFTGSFKERSMCILHERRLVIGSLLIMATLACVWHSHQLAGYPYEKTRHLKQHHHPSQQHDDYFDIVMKAYNSTFAHLLSCPDDLNMDDCISDTLESLDADAVPWWFHTMLRDSIEVVTGRWHYLSTPTPNGAGLHFCSIGKIGTKHWRRLICNLQNRDSNRGRRVCRPKTRISSRAPKAVFLRDPLERFLSAYMDKCDSWHREAERHCEPVQVFVDDNRTLLQGLDKSKKLEFETYVNTMPLKWNMHFFPQSLYCDGLYRNLDTFDFVGIMGENFYRDLDKMGRQFGVTKELQDVFQYENKTTSHGIEQSSALHVQDYYTPSTVRKVMEYLAMDYVMLNLTIPKWAKDMLDSEAEGTSRSSGVTQVSASS